jgi:PIN domain nuclease of toxin-antitoxin system
VDGMLDDLQALGMTIDPFMPEDAEVVGRLWAQTQPYGLSLGDRACLSLGLMLRVSVLTSDRIWLNLSLDLDLRAVL